MYKTQVENYMAALTGALFELYGDRWDFYQILGRLEEILSKSDKARSSSLKKLDEDFLKGQKSAKEPWYLSNKSVGTMLYVDLFADNLKNLASKISWFKEMGINYVHLMPLFKTLKGDNDGGYAVSSYREVQKKLGSMNDLKALADLFRKEGIHTVIDFVFNHTSDEHEWAKKAKAGDPKFREYYYIYKNKSDADEWNKTLREIFPSVRRGSFTYVKEAGGWVWTTFNSFQWDLNYSNPEVFLSMVQEMLFLANAGIEVLRLDALAFVWKEKGTVCESLPKAYTLIKAFSLAAKIAAPSLFFKSEAIVHPDQVIKYIGSDRCQLSYNPLQMALFWSSLASRDARLLTLSMKKRWAIPESCAWVNYIRCHDDIGWTFSDEEAWSLGINPYEHRKFLNRFYTGRFEGTFARGEAFQENPTTGDCRVCGTMASLAGLEDALEKNDPTLKDMAIRRIRMLYGLLFALPGLPLLYAGDEEAMLNDYSYRKKPELSGDSRWVHRVKKDWNKKLLPEQKTIRDQIKKMAKTRAKEKNFAGNAVWFYDQFQPETFAFCRNDKIHVAANFSERSLRFKIWSKKNALTDLLTGKKYDASDPIILEPYAILWLKEE
ncbi:MAG: alpha-amylase family protein [Treponema sp.]|nr:alpha-amylase family protein [Treponema sp.]